MEDNNQTVLPRNVVKLNFDKAIEKFKQLLGNDSVLIKNEDLAPYMKVMMPKPEAEFAPSAVIQATTVEQVQEIVSICNEFKIPVWSFSTGNNLGYGSAAPHHRGQVILDLKRMNKII